MIVNDKSLDPIAPPVAPIGIRCVFDNATLGCSDEINFEPLFGFIGTAAPPLRILYLIVFLLRICFLLRLYIYAF
jgi:hypothetical protein